MCQRILIIIRISFLRCFILDLYNTVYSPCAIRVYCIPVRSCGIGIHISIGIKTVTFAIDPLPCRSRIFAITILILPGVSFLLPVCKCSHRREGKTCSERKGRYTHKLMFFILHTIFSFWMYIEVKSLFNI